MKNLIQPIIYIRDHQDLRPFTNYVTWGLVHSIRQLINWLLWRGYFGSLGHALVAVASMER